MGLIEYLLLVIISFMIVLVFTVRHLQDKIKTLENRQKAHKAMIVQIKEFIGVHKKS